MKKNKPATKVFCDRFTAVSGALPTKSLKVYARKVQPDHCNMNQYTISMGFLCVSSFNAFQHKESFLVLKLHLGTRQQQKRISCCSDCFFPSSLIAVAFR